MAFPRNPRPFIRSLSTILFLSFALKNSIGLYLSLGHFGEVSLFPSGRGYLSFSPTPFFLFRSPRPAVAGTQVNLRFLTRSFLKLEIIFSGAFSRIQLPFVERRFDLDAGRWLFFPRLPFLREVSFCSSLANP